jgi:hypothetical protein
MWAACMIPSGNHADGGFFSKAGDYLGIHASSQQQPLGVPPTGVPLDLEERIAGDDGNKLSD